MEGCSHSLLQHPNSATRISQCAFVGNFFHCVINFLPSHHSFVKSNCSELLGRFFPDARLLSRSREEQELRDREEEEEVRVFTIHI